jgi:hypothetical protein
MGNTLLPGHGLIVAQLGPGVAPLADKVLSD